MPDLIELTDMERRVLKAVDAGGRVAVPGDVARALGFTRQRVVRLVADLEEFGLVKVRRLPKQVSYAVTDEGRRYLP
jgi:DNA-binding MarR family transcriptional regulator